MNAAEILVAAGLDSEDLRAALYPVDPASVKVVSAPAVMRWLWPKGIRAMALMRRIYLDPPLLHRDASRLGGLIIHELTHVRQWADYGFFGFLRRYVSEYWRGRRQGLGHDSAYLSNRLEAEARDMQQRFTVI